MCKQNIPKRIMALIITLALCLSVAPATSLAAAPAAPKGFKGTALSTSSVKLTWKKVSKAKSYTIYKKSGSKYVKLVTLSAKYASYTVKKLKAGTKYYYKIAVKTSKGTSKTSAAIGVKTKGIAPKPTPTPTAKATPIPTSKPTAAPTRAPGKVDNSLLGLWTFTYSGGTLGASSMFEFKSDGTFSMTLVTISYGTDRYTLDRSGYYSAENGVVKCSDITRTETRAESSGGIWFEKSKTQGKIDDFQFEYIVGTDENGPYLYQNYDADGTRDPIENETVKYRLLRT